MKENTNLVSVHPPEPPRPRFQRVGGLFWVLNKDDGSWSRDRRGRCMVSQLEKFVQTADYADFIWKIRDNRAIYIFLYEFIIFNKLVYRVGYTSIIKKFSLACFGAENRDFICNERRQGLYSLSH